METAQKSWYRPDIDGLRALAILPVLLFHAGVAGFTGGFVGVDIFFVISGFLITSIIYREIQLGKFSLLTFWERRARRILPALFVVIMATLAAGYFIVLFPIDYIDLGQSAFAQALFLANIFFMRNNGYFAGPSESMPLLHTWSLSVEEQFYIGFPLLMLLLWKFGKRAILPSLLFIGVASLSYSFYLLHVAPGDGFALPFVPNVWSGALNASAAFFFLPSRAFELVIGAVLAITAYSISHKKVAESVALIGLLMIVYAIATFSEHTAFPGVYALIPTLGTAALIAANGVHRTLVGQVLAFPLFIWIGLISYSLYLWHWPIIVLTKVYQNTTTLTTLEVGFVLLLTFILAYISYRFVETPFRLKQVCATRTPMLLSGIASLIVMGGLGLAIANQSGFPTRSSDEALAIAAATVDFDYRRSECFVNSFSTSNEPCYIGQKDKDSIDFVVWGDSHGMSLLPVIDDTAIAHNLSGATFFAPGCVPVSKTDTEPSIKKCQDVKELARTFIREHNVQEVILISRWTGYENFIPIDGTTTTERDSFSIFSDALEVMADELAEEGVTITIVKQVPVHLSYNARALFYEKVQSADAEKVHGIAYADYQRSQGPVNTVFDAVAATHDNVHIIDPSTILCADSKTCLLVKDGVLLYENADHINKTGSYHLAPLFEDLFTSIQ